MLKSGLKAVVFDIGGVVVGSPLEGIQDYEAANGIPHNYINIIIVRYGPKGAFQRLERGELDMDAFYRAFEAELTDPANYPLYEEYLKARGKPVPPRPAQIKIDAVQLFAQMMAKAATPNPHMIEAIQQLKARGFKVAALTNNFQPSSSSSSPSVPSTNETGVPGLFDHFIESSVEGLRKPDPAFFKIATDRLQVVPSECVFLDDLGMYAKEKKKKRHD